MRVSLVAKLEHSCGFLVGRGVSTDLGNLAGSSRNYAGLQQGVLHPLGWVIRLDSDRGESM